MGVKPGYKQTEVGVIPEDWEVKPLNRISPRQSVGLVINPSTYFDKAGTVPLLVGSNVSENRIDAATANRITKASNDLLTASRVAAGDLVTVRVGEPGVTAVVPPELDGCNCASMMIVRQHPSFDSNWLCCMMNSRHGRRQVEHVQYGTAQKQFNISDAVDFLYPAPALPEQRAIAAALSDVDALLGGLDRLIAKKRDLKQAAMQQLLTGQTRLPGFSGAWEETRFDKVVRHHAGNSTLIKGKLPPSEAVGLFPAFSASGQDVWCDHFEHEGDAIVVSAVGSRCGKAFAASGKWCAIANTHVVWPNPAKIDGRFLGYFINDEDFWQKSGTGQPFVLFTKTFARPLRLPALPEQTAIATVLSDMDAELAALEARRAKTRDLKQAMMQELLTGKTRLVKPEAAHA